MKFLWPSEELLKNHYADLSSKAFFPGLIKYMVSGSVVPIVWKGLDSVKTGRFILGATDQKIQTQELLEEIYVSKLAAILFMDRML